MNTFELSLDLDKSVGAKQWITLRQGDKRGTTLQATLYDHGVLVSGSYTCRVSIRHPNRNTYYRETATYSNGVATVTIDETSAASVVGVTEGYFELLQGSTLIASTESFGVRVLQSATDGATVGPPYDSAIEDALAELDAATGRISQMVVDATAEYLAAHPEITTTVQDNSVTDAKLVQKGGVLDRVGRLWWRLENLLTNTPAEAESVTVSDAAKTPVAGLTVFGKSTQDGTPTPDAPVAIESVESANLCTTPNTAASGGLTFTPNADGSLDVNGTANGTCTVYFSSGGGSGHENEMTLPAGSYALSGCPKGGSNGSWFLRATVTSKATGTVLGRHQNHGNGVIQFSISEECWCSVFFRAVSGNSFSHQRLAPMLARQPFAPFVTYDSVGLWTRSRNLARSHLTETYTYNGITWTYAGDGKWNATGSTGSATSSNQWTTYLLGVLPAGDYTVTMTPLSGTITGTGLAIAYRTGANAETGGRILGVSSGGRVTSTLTADGTSCYWLQPYIRENTTVTNLVLGMQVEVGSATAFTPYAESVTALPVDGHVLRSLPDGTRDEVTVDQYGHVTLVQRVGHVVLDGSENWSFNTSGGKTFGFTRLPGALNLTMAQSISKLACSRFAPSMTRADGTMYQSDANALFWTGNSYTPTNAEEAKAWAAANPMTVLYTLATPVTIDLGTIDPTALVGPDMTAQAVPTAPFALTYERDLNTTLARLEAAIADAATA